MNPHQTVRVVFFLLCGFCLFFKLPSYWLQLEGLVKVTKITSWLCKCWYIIHLSNAGNHFLSYWEISHENEQMILRKVIKFKLQKQFYPNCCTVKYSSWRGDHEKIQNTAFECAFMKDDPSAVVRAVVSPSLQASVVTAKREQNICSLYLMP